MFKLRLQILAVLLAGALLNSSTPKSERPDTKYAAETRALRMSRAPFQTRNYLV
jgi:hypothetical protein